MSALSPAGIGRGQYARDVADKVDLAEVQVLRWNGVVEEYHVGASIAAGRPSFSKAISTSSRIRC